MPVPGFDPGPLSSAWDLEEMFATIYSDEQYARADVAFYVDLIRTFAPKAVIDSFGLPACIVSLIVGTPETDPLPASAHALTSDQSFGSAATRSCQPGFPH